MDDAELDRIHLNVRKGRARKLRARGRGDLAKILENPKIKTYEFTILTEKTKKESAYVVGQFTADMNEADAQNKLEAAETKLACDQTSRALDNINNTELQNSIKEFEDKNGAGLLGLLALAALV